LGASSRPTADRGGWEIGWEALLSVRVGNTDAAPGALPGRGGQEGVGAVQIKISARHGHLDEATQQFIRDKTSKLLRFFERLTMIEVTVDLKDPLSKQVELVVSAEHKHDFVARERNTDILAAVDLVVDKLENQLRRYKEKVQDRRRTPSAGEVTGAPVPEEPGEE
jgi:putative sigma-54 modulation protein